MYRGTKIYALVLGLAVAALLVLFLYQPAAVRELNDRLAADPILAAYPYPFRVLRIEDHTAVMGTPRSAQLPVRDMIHAIDPGLAGVATDDPAFQQAQQTLAEHQARASELVRAHASIQRIRWELDVDWLRRQGIVPPP
ncbi:glutamate-ammonia-ligase adenylyltransferase [Thiohalobacter thiocyanaticus]|uniref:glutamate-ammonia-ligase adenylyltransferase n=1 Tax=Thiohalobacter thiocyanaticus TaxID=585455 RepID=UPI000BBB5751|nr:glutamate-ammonia-ligase adenylyltransferase [Thiohalobacter thiocyanaticus]